MPEVPSEKISKLVQKGIDSRVASIKFAVEELLYQYAEGSLSRAQAESAIAQISGLVGVGLNEVDTNSRAI